MKTALFAEGPQEILDEEHPFVRLWQDAVLGNLNLPKFDFVYAINKKYLISMRPNAPKMSGASLKLDEFIERKRIVDNFDCAVVAWDLVPGWAGGVGGLCRWEETVEFYKGIASSTALPAAWANYAKTREKDLTSRRSPSQRTQLTKLAPNAILAVCMDTMFESLIVADEQAVKKALGCSGKRISDWPRAWKNLPPRPDSDLLSPAISAARKFRPKLEEAFAVRGDLITAKHEWGYYFLNSMLAPTGSQKCRNHQIATRLREIL